MWERISVISTLCVSNMLYLFFPSNQRFYTKKNQKRVDFTEFLSVIALFYSTFPRWSFLAVNFTNFPWNWGIFFTLSNCHTHPFSWNQQFTLLSRKLKKCDMIVNFRNFHTVCYVHTMIHKKITLTSNWFDGKNNRIYNFT